MSVFTYPEIDLNSRNLEKTPFFEREKLNDERIEAWVVGIRRLEKIKTCTLIHPLKFKR